jgi:hypothetical protein
VTEPDEPLNLDGLEAVASAWALLNKVRDVPLAERSQFIDQWLACVSKCPLLEQDNLLTRGKDVFNYRMETARQTMAERHPKKGEATEITPSIVCDDGRLVEMYWSPTSDRPVPSVPG